MKQRLIKAFFTVSKPSKPATVASGPRLSPWHAVSVVCGSKACPVARQLSGQRWLSKEAPRLPVPGCGAAKCDCRYRHHDDRRAKLRRQFDRESFNRHFDGEDRRVQPRGRRASDI